MRGRSGSAPAYKTSMRPLAVFALALASGCASATPAPTRQPKTGVPIAATPPPSAVTAAALPEDPPPPLADAATWSEWARADMLILTPKRFHAALAPLVEHRTAHGHSVAVLDVEGVYAKRTLGKPEATVLQSAVKEIADHAEGKLRYLLLVGDVQSPKERASDEFSVPTFYLKKVPYTRADIGKDELYPSDYPYALTRGGPLAVGRIPARSEAEVAGFVRKIVRYETVEQQASAVAAWRRRITLVAGPANFGQVADAMIESVATRLLDQELSYDYDLAFTFANASSPYAYRFDKLGEKFMADMGEGSVVAAYVGHGGPSGLDAVWFRARQYEIADTEMAAKLRIPTGKPVFFSLACDTGAFDRWGGENSLAEELALNPEGPVAVFAASRESHPYANALYGEALIERFVNERPKTLGDGILAMKASMLERAIPLAELLVQGDAGALKREHESLYNLFGDPATSLPYPGPLTIEAPAHAGPGARIAVRVRTKSGEKGRAVLTLESLRGAMQGPVTPASALAAMTQAQAFAAMAENHRRANEKVVSRASGEVKDGVATFQVVLPRAPGEYVVKALVSGDDVFAGHAKVEVGP